jgi:integrase
VAERRRGRGEGSIYRRKDGRWVGQYEAGGKRRYVYGKSRKEAAGKLARAVADENDGLIFDSEKISPSLGTSTSGWIAYGARCAKALGLGTKSTSAFI